jgi:hypothetical protein
MNAAVKLVARLALVQVLVGTVTMLIVVAFAPRLLLLDPVVIDGSVPLVAWGGTASLAFLLAATFVATWRVRPLLRAMGMDSRAVEPIAVLDLYAVPARLVTMDVVGVLVICASTLLHPLRPDTNDLYTQVELVLLTMTIVSVAALPLYVTLRATVARTLELVPVAASREAIELLETATKDLRRVRRRLTGAVVAPVAFVALGAALLVHAQVRASDTSARQTDAAHLAEGVLEPISGDTRGRREAAEEARLRGFVVDLSHAGAAFGALRNDEGQTVLTTPLEDGHATIRFETARVSPGTGNNALIAFVAIAIATNAMRA